MTTITPQIFIAEDAEELFESTAEHLVQRIAEAIAARGSCHLALAGGNTPRDLYELLATPGWRARIDWGKLHIYFSDERCVPPSSPDSNYRMAATALLDPVALPHAQRHRMRGEINPHQAAIEYHQILHEHLPKEGGRPTLDLVLLGVGPDGHTASLFPDTAILFERESLTAEVYVERLDTWRLSLTLTALDAAREVIVLVSGEGKAAIVAQSLGAPQPGVSPLPVTRLQACNLRWHLDADAASALPEALRGVAG